MYVPAESILLNSFYHIGKLNSVSVQSEKKVENVRQSGCSSHRKIAIWIQLLASRKILIRS